MSLFRNRFTVQERRRVSIAKEQERVKEIKSEHIKSEFEKELEVLSSQREKVVYSNYKLSHQGITHYKTFENCSRKVRKSSLANLLNVTVEDSDQWKDGKPFDESFGIAPKDEKDYRVMNSQQVRRCRSACNKLSYYSSVREFRSKKSGKYKFKVAFISLGAPVNSTNEQILKAFEGFLDYLRRTANCVFVWKKEIGEDGKLLHFHIMINNFIPYYIVSWKWKRLLIAQGVIWPKNDKGIDTNAHTRIELPRSKKLVASYISKYIAKNCELHKTLGYLWGCSDIIKECKEIVLIESEVDNKELWNVIKCNKTVGTEYVSLVCCDLMKVKDLAPMLYNIFLKQFYEFREKLSLPQRFSSV